jgi:parvulin-like peptidyl-prolyl isomerase
MVGTQAITAEAFQFELTRRAQSAPGRFADPAAKQAVLEELIRFEALHQKALAAGYDRDPQIAASLKRMIVSKYQEDQLAKLGAPKVTPEEIAEFYQKNPERFGTPAKVRAALIELKVPRTATPEKRAEAAARAAAALAEARTNAAPEATFGLVAQKYSEHQASRYRGGDIGWLTVGVTNSEWPPVVVEALFKLSQPGETSPVIETPAAFYLVKLVERQPAKLRPLAEVQDGVAYLVARQKEQQRQEELHAMLKQGLNIQINQALLDSISVPRQDTRPPGVPGGPTP